MNTGNGTDETPHLKAPEIEMAFMTGVLFGLATRASATLRDMYMLLNSNEFKASQYAEKIDAEVVRSIAAELALFAADVFMSKGQGEEEDTIPEPLDKTIN